MVKKGTIFVLASYKLIASFLRILIGTTILGFKCDFNKFTDFVLSSRVMENHPVGFFISRHIAQVSNFLTCNLAFLLILFSFFEILFVFALVTKRRWGAIGLFVVSILWIPVEILFISKFLLAPKMITLVIDLIILGVLANIIFTGKKVSK